MPAPFHFPGHYWDEARQKFYKVEGTGTTPEGAFWSREQVSHAAQRETRQRVANERHRRHEERHRRLQAKRQDGGLAVARSRTRAGVHGLDSHKEEDDNDDGLRGPASSGSRWFGNMPGMLAGLFARATGAYMQSHDATVSDGLRFKALPESTGAALVAHELHCYGSIPVVVEHDGLAWEARHGAYRDGLIFRGAQQYPPRSPTHFTVSCMHVQGGQPLDDRDRLGIVYTNCPSGHGSEDVKGSYILTDERECISSSWPTDGPKAKYARFQRTRPEKLQSKKISAICYHPGSDHLVVTSSQPDAGHASVYVYRPRKVHDPDLSLLPWRLGNADGNGEDGARICGILGKYPLNAVYACAVAPPSSPGLLGVVGTDRGLSLLDLEGLRLEPLAAVGSDTASDNFHGHYRRYKSFQAFAFGRTPVVRTPSDRIHHDHRLITTVDFYDHHPQLVLAGGRCPDPWLVDLREPQRMRWHRFGGDMAASDGVVDDNDTATESNAVAHIRAVGHSRVVVAHLRDKMVLYDVRFMRRPPGLGLISANSASRGGRRRGRRDDAAEPHSEAWPLLRFPQYFNESCLLATGFAVDTRLQVAAVGEQHAAYTGLGGGVSLFSLQTGERLDAPRLVADGVSHSNQTIDRVYDPPAMATSAPGEIRMLPRIAALSFADLPGQDFNLFVPVGAEVRKYSIGNPDLDEPFLDALRPGEQNEGG